MGITARAALTARSANQSRAFSRFPRPSSFPRFFSQRRVDWPALPPGSAGYRFRPLLGDVAPGSFRVAGSISGSAAALPGEGVGITMSTMFADTLLIVFISVCTALLAEGECWAAAGRAAASSPQRAGGACLGWALEAWGGLGAGPGPAVPSVGGTGRTRGGSEGAGWRRCLLRTGQ